MPTKSSKHSILMKKYKTSSDFEKAWYGEVEYEDDDAKDILTTLRTGGTVTVKKQTTTAKGPSKKKTPPSTISYDPDKYPIPDNFYNSDGTVDLDTAASYIEGDLYEMNQGLLASEIDDAIVDLESMLEPAAMRKILLNILLDLAKDGNNDFIFIKHEEARQYYEKYTEAVKKVGEAYSMCRDREQRRTDALNKLTPEERDLLGIQ